MPRESPIKEDLNVPHVGIPAQAWRFLVLSKRKTGLRANRINNKKKACTSLVSRLDPLFNLRFAFLRCRSVVCVTAFCMFNARQLLNLDLIPAHRFGFFLLVFVL